MYPVLKMLETQVSSVRARERILDSCLARSSCFLIFRWPMTSEASQRGTLREKCRTSFPDVAFRKTNQIAAPCQIIIKIFDRASRVPMIMPEGPRL